LYEEPSEEILMGTLLSMILQKSMTWRMKPTLARQLGPKTEKDHNVKQRSWQAE